MWECKEYNFESVECINLSATLFKSDNESEWKESWKKSYSSVHVRTKQNYLYSTVQINQIEIVTHLSMPKVMLPFDIWKCTVQETHDKFSHLL